MCVGGRGGGGLELVCVFVCIYVLYAQIMGDKHLGPVFQSIVSLTVSLVKDSLSQLYNQDTKRNHVLGAIRLIFYQ